MTTYLYHCETCNRQVEVRARMTETHSNTHEECGTKMRRVWTAPGIQFKGSGFYATSGRRN